MAVFLRSISAFWPLWIQFSGLWSQAGLYLEVTAYKIVFQRQILLNFIDILQTIEPKGIDQQMTEDL